MTVHLILAQEKFLKQIRMIQIDLYLQMHLALRQTEFLMLDLVPKLIFLTRVFWGVLNYPVVKAISVILTYMDWKEKDLVGLERQRNEKQV